ncbi:ANTAR domain-containing protein [Geodermatophilus sp. SYSU D00742]
MTATPSPILSPVRSASATPAPPATAHPAPPPSRPAPVARRLAGRFRYERRTGSWSWSPEMTTLLDCGHGGAHPCTELLVRSLHSGDRPHALGAIAAACTNGAPFSLQVRLRGRGGTERPGVLIGEPVLDAAGAVEALEGLLVALPAEPAHTPHRGAGGDAQRVRELETEVAQLRTAMGSRAAIEQAKGIVMLLTGCGDQVAFDVLAHISSNSHRKVRDVAVAITESAAGHASLPADIRALIRDVCPPSPRMH